MNCPPAPTASGPGSPGAESPSSHSQQQRGLPEDLGVDKPVQVRLVTLSQLVSK